MIPSSEHNEILVDDELTTISFNYQWRQIIAPILQTGLGKWSSTIDDAADRETFDLRCLALYEDFYNEEIVPTNVKAFTVERTTTSFALAHSAWQPIPVDDGKNPTGVADFSSVYIKILEGGLWSVNLIMSVRNAATNASLKLASLRNRTQNNRPCIGVSTNLGASAIVRHWNALHDIFECDDGDEFEFELFSTLSNATIESDGTIGSVASRCLQADFMKLAE